MVKTMKPNYFSNNQIKRRAAEAHNNHLDKIADAGKSLRLMKTVDENISLSEPDRLNMLKNAKGGSWRDGWKPYCIQCSTMARMNQKEYGFQCGGCGNMVGWDLTRLRESPLNSELKFLADENKSKDKGYR